MQFYYRLARWALKKYKRLKGSFKKAYRWIREIKSSYPTMFYQSLDFIQVVMIVQHEPYDARVSFTVL